ncbi:hypothetical protein [Deinococcus planocerae]|uniref:hypothetical protein n=1 Tax=Deinococcus planocerae TaxID=1737569 RepID=UPI000C7F14B4|nr:hypothetical protein [Deinococcus planocerae]
MTKKTRGPFPWLVLFALVCAALGLANRAYGWGWGGLLTAAFILLPVIAGWVWGMFRKSG